LKIILHYNDVELDERSIKIIIEWIKKNVEDKSCENISPLRYVDRVEVEA